MKRFFENLYGQLLLAFGAGAVSVAAFAPFSLSLLALFTPLPLFLLWRKARPRQAFLHGWFYGLGLLGFGVFWMHISIDQFGNMGTLPAIALTLLFVAAVSLLYGLVGWLAARLGQWFLMRSSPLVILWLIPSLWVLGEWVRGWLFTGFPWLSLGYSQIESPLAGYAPVLGVYGVSWVVLLTSGMLAMLVLAEWRGRAIAVSLIALIWFGGWQLNKIQWSESAGEPLRVSMIQGNIPQALKWKREQLGPTLKLYTRLTRENWTSDLIIWPETAIPAFAHHVEEGLLKPLQGEAIENGSEVLIGIPVWKDEARQYFNAMMLLGKEPDSYYKRHLVPFGEFMPLDSLLRPITKWLDIPMSNFTAGSPSDPVLKVAGYPAGLSICYEDAFGEEVIEALPVAAYLINVSNDAWFGDSLAPPQHLEIARMRALETGRYLLRSTNTGISAIIGPKGELLEVSQQFREQVIKGEITPLKGATPYTVTGNIAVVATVTLLVIIFIVVTLLSHRWRQTAPLINS